MQFRVLLLSVLCVVSSLSATPNLLGTTVAPVALATKNIPVEYVVGDVSGRVQKRVRVSADALRWLKTFSKKEDFAQRIKSGENAAATELKLLFAANKSDALALITPKTDDSVVVQLIVDAQGAKKVVVYGSAPVCSEWVAALVDAAVIAAQKSWSLGKIGAIGVGIASGIIGLNKWLRSTLSLKDVFSFLFGGKSYLTISLPDHSSKKIFFDGFKTLEDLKQEIFKQFSKDSTKFDLQILFSGNKVEDISQLSNIPFQEVRIDFVQKTSAAEPSDAADEHSDAADEHSDDADEHSDAADEHSDAAAAPSDAAAEPSDAAAEPSDAAAGLSDAAAAPYDAADAPSDDADEHSPAVDGGSAAVEMGKIRVSYFVSGSTETHYVEFDDERLSYNGYPLSIAGLKALVFDLIKSDTKGKYLFDSRVALDRSPVSFFDSSGRELGVDEIKEAQNVFLKKNVTFKALFDGERPLTCSTTIELNESVEDLKKRVHHLLNDDCIKHFTGKNIQNQKIKNFCLGRRGLETIDDLLNVAGDITVRLEYYTPVSLMMHGDAESFDLGSEGDVSVSVFYTSSICGGESYDGFFIKIPVYSGDTLEIFKERFKAAVRESALKPENTEGVEYFFDCKISFFNSSGCELTNIAQIQLEKSVYIKKMLDVNFIQENFLLPIEPDESLDDFKSKVLRAYRTKKGFFGPDWQIVSFVRINQKDCTQNKRNLSINDLLNTKTGSEICTTHQHLISSSCRSDSFPSEGLVSPILASIDQALAVKITDSSRRANLYAEDCGADKKFSRAGLSVWSMQGCKRASDRSYKLNEDAVDFLHRDGWTALAVYDGYNGRHIADALCAKKGYFCTSLLEMILDSLKRSSDHYGNIERSFRSFDDLLSEQAYGSCFTDYDEWCGSTAGIILFNKDEDIGYMIGLGDVVPFACSLSSDHVQYACCAPHSNMTSKTGLSVDHSFGAFGKSRLYKSRSAVISEWTIKITPKINSFKPSEFDYFVVMSDGVHKKIEPQNIGAILRTEVGKEAEFLCKQAILSPYNTDFQDHASAIVLNKKRFFQDLDSTETSLKSSSDSDMVGMPRSPIARRQSVLSVADIAAGGSAFGSVSGAAASTDRLLEAHQYLAAKITDPRKIANLYAEDCGADKKFSKSGLSVWSMEGFDASGRSYLNEDAVDFLEKDGWTALAVYDGHAGGRAISDALAGVNKMHSGRLLDDLIEAAKTQELTEDTCLEVFKRFDDRMLDLENGSTAAVILFNQSLIKGYMIVLGDSQPVAIYSNGELKTLEPHDPPAAGSELAEAKWPLDHAFGNFDYKEWQDCKECSMKIEPKVQKFNPAGVEYFVVASDGVYEHQRVALAETRSILNSAPEGREAELLCKTAAMNAFKNSLPHDDVSAIVLKMS